MAKVAINAMSLRRGGGLQVIAGLLSRFSNKNQFVVLWTDPDSYAILNKIVGDPPHIEFVNPLDRTRNIDVFRWGMTSQASWLSRHSIDCVFGVNHHFPSGSVPQIILHLNVLRFERPKLPIWGRGEVADRLRDWRAAKAVRMANANLFESHTLLEKAQSKYRSIQNASVVYIGLDDRRPIANPPQLSDDDKYTILAVTSPAPHKDNVTLIRMLACLVARMPDAPWKLQVAGGDGVESFGELQDLATELGVGDRIAYLGFVLHDDLVKFGARSLCLVSTSRVESFCMVALEAMSWGCPTVVANTSSMPESIGDAGLLAEPGNAEDFADQVLHLTAPDVRERYVARGHKRAGELTWSNAAGTVERILEGVMNRTGV